jgi:hypothetical protein
MIGQPILQAFLLLTRVKKTSGIDARDQLREIAGDIADADKIYGTQPEIRELATTFSAEARGAGIAHEFQVTQAKARLNEYAK